METETTNKLYKREDFPTALEPKHIKLILDMGINQVLTLLKNDPPFFAIRIGNRFKVSNSAFFDWFEGKNQAK